MNFKNYENKMQFEKMKWLFKAISKDAKRPHLGFACYVAEEKHAVATDGHRLHLLKIDLGDSDLYLQTSSKEGFLCRTSDEYLKEFSMGFPEYKRVIPEANDTWQSVALDAFSSYKKQRGVWLGYNYARIVRHGVVLNTDYLLDVADMDSRATAKICKTEAAPVIFKFECGSVGVVMPMRD